MTVLDRILQLRMERGWSEYRLSEESGIAQTTISSWFRKGVCPSVPSLEKICKAYNITMPQFFDYDGTESVSLTPQQAELIKQWSKLNSAQQNIFLELLKTL